MRAAQVIALDGPTGVRVNDVAPPTAASGQVLVAATRWGCPSPISLMSRGKYQIQPDLPFTLGIDFAGVVRETFPISGSRQATASPAGRRTAALLRSWRSTPAHLSPPFGAVVPGGAAMPSTT